MIFVLILTVTISVGVSFGVMVNDISKNQGMRLETVENQAQSLFYAAEKELNAISLHSQFKPLVQAIGSQLAGKDAVVARKELITLLIESASDSEFFKELFVVTPTRVYSSSGMVEINAKERLAWHIKTDGPPQVVDLQGLTMQDMLAYVIVNDHYLVAKLNMDYIFSTSMDSLVVLGAYGDILYSSSQLKALKTGLEPGKGANNPSLALNKGLFDFRQIDGKMYKAISYENISQGRTYLYFMPFEEIINAMAAALPALLYFCFAQLLLMGLLLYIGAWLAVKPTREISRQIDSWNHGETPIKTPLFNNKKIGRGSLRTRVFASFLLTLIPVVITPFIVSALFSMVTTSYSKDSYRQAVSQIAYSVSNHYSQLARKAEILRTNPKLKEWFITEALSESSVKEEYSSTLLWKALLELMPNLDGVTGFRIYDQYGEEFFRTTTHAPLLDDKLLKEYESSYKYLSFFTDIKDNDSAVLFPIRATEAASAYRLFSSLGYIELHAEAPTTGKLNTTMYTESELWYVYDAQKEKLLDMPQMSSINTVIETILKPKLTLLNRKSVLEVFFYEDKEYLLLSEPIAATPMYLTVALPNKVFNVPYTILFLAMLIVVLVLMLLFILLSSLFTRRFMQSVQRLESYLAFATTNSPFVPHWLETEGEITAIAQAFERSLIKIHKLEQEQRRRQEEQMELEKRKRDAEIVVLQSQLDSHLISNTFASMQLMLRLQDITGLRQMLQAVSAFFRNELGMKDSDLPLAKEIALTRSYIDVQKLRFCENLEVEWLPYDLKLEKTIVPKFILQPIIENAITHGFSGETLVVRIRIWAEDSLLHLAVVNNGMGLTPQLMNDINQRIDEDKPTTHIGLRNIMERLRLRYDKNCGVQMTRDDHQGVCVHIWLPINKEEDHDV